MPRRLLDRGRPPRPRHRHQWRDAVVGRQQGIGAALGEQTHDVDLAVLGGEPERRRPRQGRGQGVVVEVALQPAPPREADVRVGAVRAQGPDQLAVAAQHGGVQGGVPGGGVPGVGAPLQQELGEPALVAEAGQHQRGLAVRRPIVDVGARVEQEPRVLDAAVAGREEQRRRAALGLQHGLLEGVPHAAVHRQEVTVGSRARRRRRRASSTRTASGFVLGGRPHQRRLPVRLLAGVDVGAVVDERGQRIGGAGPRARHQRGLAHRGGRVRVGPRVEELPDHRRAPVRAGEVEGRHAVVVGGVRVGAGPEQGLDHRGVVAQDRPVQRRRPVALAGVDVDLLIEQRAHRRVVLAPGRLDQPEVGVLGGDAGDTEPRHRRRSHPLAAQPHADPPSAPGLPTAGSRRPTPPLCSSGDQTPVHDAGGRRNPVPTPADSTNGR